MTRSSVVLIVLCGLSLLVGCIGQPSSPSRFYILHELDAESGTVSSGLEKDGEYLQVGPIRMPRYLDRPQIVSRSSDNQLVLGEFDRWSEPLHESFTRVIAGNLGKLLKTDNILIYPNRGPAEDDFYQLRMDVTRFDGRLGGEIELEVRWTIVGRKNRKVMPLVREHHFESVGGDDYRAYVMALNRILTTMSRSIAERIAFETAQD